MVAQSRLGLRPNWRDWPASPTKLSSELKRLTKPLAAIGITCLTGVDRRYTAPGGTQSDVVIEYAGKEDAAKTKPIAVKQEPTHGISVHV